MTMIDCPRCHGGKYREDRGYILPKKENPTMRIDNVMGSTKMIYYKCGNCGYKEKISYAEDERREKEGKKHQKQTTLGE